MLRKILLLSAAGVLGTLCRYGLAGWVQRNAGATFPWGTFTVNMAGCFLAGFVWSLAEERFVISTETRAIILIGFMGAFTTFSAYMLETSQLMRDAEWLRAFANILLQNIVGIAAMILGLVAGRSF